MLGIKSLTISLDNVAVELNSNDLVSMELAEHTDQELPSVFLSFVSSTALTERDALLHAGSQLDIDITLSDDQTGQYNYRVFNYRVEPQSNGRYAYTIIAQTALSANIDEARFDSIEGNSAEVIRQIARKYFDIVDVPATNDAQVWLNTGNSDLLWINEIVSRAYLDDTSSFVWQIDKDARFRMANMRDAITTNPTAVDVSTFRVNSDLRSNHTIGHGRAIFTSGVDGNIELIEKTGYAKSASSPQSIDMNRGELKLIQVTEVPNNAGNTHTNYIKAAYQNFRQNSIYSNSTIQVDLENADLAISTLDTIQVELSGRDSNLYSGIYLSGRNILHYRPDTAALHQTMVLGRPGLNVTNERLV